MALSETAKHELEAELEALEQQKRKLTEPIDAKIEMIRAFLKEDFFQPSLPLPQLGASVAGGNGTGLRRHILGLLENHIKGLKPAEVIRHLGAKYHPRGRTTLDRLVWGELWRMKQADLLQKTPKGRYRLSGAESMK